MNLEESEHRGSFSTPSPQTASESAQIYTLFPLSYHPYRSYISMADGPIYRDPWARREAWRKSPIFSNRAMFRSMFPGFGIAVVAFGAYLVAEQTILKPKTEDAHPHH